MRTKTNKLIKSHNDIMGIAMIARFELIMGNSKKSRKLYIKAFKKEKRLAFRVINDWSCEPTRSVILRSAIYLAHILKRSEDVTRLLDLAFLGKIPESVKNEFNNLDERLKDNNKQVH